MDWSLINGLPIEYDEDLLEDWFSMRESKKFWVQIVCGVFKLSVFARRCHRKILVNKGKC